MSDARTVADFKSAKLNDAFCIEKIYCYETKNFYFIVGSSNCKTRYRVFKIDRRFKPNLQIYDSKQVLNIQELNAYKKTEGFDSSSKINPTLAFGIVGFVRFLEGYYIILIVKRKCIAVIGCHCIYKIKDTRMLYIPNEDRTNADEQRYLKIFNNVDLKSNFYFSYSYDLSNTLQYNLSPFYSTSEQFKCGFGHRNTLWDMSEEFINKSKYEKTVDNYIYMKPNMKFVWNEHLILPMIHVHSDFFLYICHGFVSQAALPITGKNLIITLIARRSKKYAGTRFLKRGANCDGYTANEVETEQIVHDGNISSFTHGHYTSFVQIRGSVPIYWSQNIAKIPPKPPITIDIKDPFFEVAGKHFNHLLYHYGSPIIALNLVKWKEKKPQESILYREMEQSIEYLNQFLPEQHHVRFIGFDMARHNKSKDGDVINLLTKIAHYSLKKTGFFQNRTIASSRSSTWGKANVGHQLNETNGAIHQAGIIRVNCVDCLDRTNTAQFVIGRIALAYQLQAMGVLYKPHLDFDTDINRLLEELYEDHGDTLALQYGGSQLVHRIQTYRKVAPLTSQSKDIMQSLSRYYSNAFSDSDKQNAINLFLGVYKVDKSMPIWSMFTDYGLHHQFSAKLRSLDADFNRDSGLPQNVRYTKWWSDEVALCLPRAAKEFFKASSSTRNFSTCDPIFIKRIYNYDWFYDVHRLQENTVFVETFLFNMKKSKSFTDRSLKKLATNVKNQVRQSVGGIPLTSTSNDDSEPSDISDEENDIIIRFETDYDWDPDPMADYSQSMEGSLTRDSEDSTLQLLRLANENREMYQRELKTLYDSLWKGKDQRSVSHYWSYLQFPDTFSHMAKQYHAKYVLPRRLNHQTTDSAIQYTPDSEYRSYFERPHLL